MRTSSLIPLLLLTFVLFCQSALLAAQSNQSGLLKPRTNVPYERVLQEAQKLASQNKNWKIARCEGYSMNPFFTENSVLILKELAYDKIEIGMLAVYIDAEGDTVAHKIVSQSQAGWHSRAYQNDTIDPYPVTESNFLGIAFAVLNASEGPSAQLLASLDSSLMAVMGKTYED